MKDSCCCDTPSCHDCNPCQVMQSIALEEAALSHILNAEGEKIQKVVAMPNATLQDLLSVNDSVMRTIRETTSLEIILLSKLEAICRIPCPDVPLPTGNGEICVTAVDCRTGTPLSGVQLTIMKCDCVIAEGYTDSEGNFISETLPFGCYMLIVHCGACANKKYQVVIDTEGCNYLEVCCNATPPPPIPCQTHLLNVKGRITNSCGLPIRTRVTAQGLNKLSVNSDNCGNYEIIGLNVCGRFTVCAAPHNNCSNSAYCMVDNANARSYTVNLIIRNA